MRQTYNGRQFFQTLIWAILKIPVITIDAGKTASIVRETENNEGMHHPGVRRISYRPIRVFSGPIRPGSGPRVGHEWTTIELDEFYLMEYLSFSQDPFIIGKTLKYCQKANRTQKNLGRFVQEVDQSGLRMNLGRIR